DYTIAVTSDFLITDSLSMWDEHLDTIPEKESDEFNKSSVEDLVPNPSESEDFFDIEKEIDLSFNPDDPMPPSIEDVDNDSEGDILSLERLLHDDPIPLSDTLDVDFSNVVRVFLPFFTYPPGPSHRCGNFKKFNTHRSYLSESPMENIPGNLKTLAKGFYPPSLNFLSFNWES
nr:hypothetical protein [Tanacetum cinerariifolium]